MKRTTGILFVILIVIVGSCFDPPQFSKTPSISIENVRVKEVAGASTPDSLIISIGFQDGDGNIGVSGNEDTPPFHEHWFFLKNPSPTCEPGVQAPCTKVSYIDNGKLDPNDESKNQYLTYKLRRTGPPYDTLPAFVQPYDCMNYFVLNKLVGDNYVPVDTLYSEPNDRYFNLFIDVYVKNGTSFQKFNFNNSPYPNCNTNLNARLPILAKDGNVGSKLPLEGVITYKLTSASFSPLIGKTLKLKIRIMDRDGNLSNEDESNEFAFN